MAIITRLTGLEILDSRGRPTVQATCYLDSGARGTVSVPSGASTGSAEARELRDGEAGRYGGLGCRRAVHHVEADISQALAGRDFSDQQVLDEALIALDGTPDKSRLGANALLAVSLAFARARAVEAEVPLYRSFAALTGEEIHRVPRPTLNLFSGGRHAGGQVGMQDVLVMPCRAATMAEAMSIVYAVYQAAVRLVSDQYGERALVADEGGLAPDFPSSEAMLRDAVQAIARAGFKPGLEVALAMDVAATHFYRDRRYELDGSSLSSDAMMDRIESWLERFPIVSVEDGLAEEDWEHWPVLRSRIGTRALVMGDDLLCTNPARIRRAIELGAANALLLKVNQIGTLTEANEARRLARSEGWHVTISARSGETEDDWLADLAVGWSGDHIKVGSITRSERLAKYNRLLAIEKESPLRMEPCRLS